jgi:hypothetical protein
VGWRALLVAIGCGLGLGFLTWACSPGGAPATRDPFVVARATSQAAYETGREYIDHGETERGCLLMDVARTHDPDERPEIKETLQRCFRAVMDAPPVLQAPASPRPSPSAQASVGSQASPEPAASTTPARQ